MQDRKDERQYRCRTGKTQFMTDTGWDRCRTGQMKYRTDAGMVR